MDSLLQSYDEDVVIDMLIVSTFWKLLRYEQNKNIVILSVSRNLYLKLLGETYARCRVIHSLIIVLQIC